MTVTERRHDLHDKLCEILGSQNVYFQPPESVRMAYPAIRYERERIDNDSANNLIYRQEFAYRLTVIDRDPDSVIVQQISRFPRCRHERHYKADNLNHDVFIVYY